MKLHQTRTLYDYWNRLRGSQPVPCRQDIDPADIARILGDTFILETGPNHSFRFRLAGTRVGETFGFEPKGSDILRYWPPHDREAVQSLLYTVTQDCAGALIGFCARSVEGYTASGEMLVLPLRHLDGSISRLIGTVSMFSQPFWLGVQKLDMLEISSLRLIWPDETPQFLRAGQPEAALRAGGDGGDPLVFSTTRRGRRVGHLMVYEGGRSSQEA